MVEDSDHVSHRPVRVAIVADVRLYREGLARLLSSYEALSVTSIGPVDRSTLEAIRRDQPDIVLLEAGAACQTTIVQDLSAIAPDANVVAYGLTDEASQALRCAEVGVSAYVPGEASGEELARTILSLRRGEFNCSPRIAALLMRRVCALSRSATPEPSDQLTARELGVVAFIADGLSNKEIAARLGIELSTVKNHVHHILEKLKVTRRTQAVARVRSGRLPSVGRRI
jgi:two-component system nitrate/nitrite response regulator NarL